MILRYTPLARQDLHEIEDYIKNDLANPQAAKNTVQRILKGCSNLKPESVKLKQVKMQKDR